MRTKLTFALLFLNVALFLFMFYVERREEDQGVQRRVLGPEATNIQSLEITAADPAQAMRLEHRNDTWMLTRPLEWPANEFAVKRILNELQFLEHETSFAVEDLATNGQTLADYGLEKPPLTLTFTPAASDPNGATPPPVTLRIGDSSQVGNRLYILSPDGKRVHVVSRSLAESLTLRLEDLRADTLFTVPVFEVRSFNLQIGAPTGLRVRLRRDNNRWSFESPIVTRASKTATELTINALNALRTQTFLLDAEAESGRTGLNAPALRVTLEGNNRRETLLIGHPIEAGPPPPAGSSPPSAAAEPVDLYHAKMEDKTPVFTVELPRTLIETLRNAQETLRETRILDFDPSNVTSITIAAPNQPELALQRLEAARPGGAAWQIIRRGDAAKSTPADAELVDKLLQSLALLSAERFLSDAPSEADRENYGFTRPVREVTLTSAPRTEGGLNTQLPTLTLQLGVTSATGNEVNAKLANQPFIYRVTPEIVNDISTSPLAYRERLLRELPQGAQIVALKLADLNSGETVLDLSLPLPAEAEPLKVDQAALDKLLVALRTLRAKNFVTGEFTKTVAIEGEERAWRYRLDTTLSLVGGTTAQTATSTLFFSERLGGTTQIAGSSEFDVVFTVEQPLADGLFGLIYGSRDPGPPAPPQAAATEPAAAPAMPAPPTPSPTPPEAPATPQP